MKKYLILLFTVLTSLHVSAQSDGSQLWLGKQYANSCQVISQLPDDATAKIAKQELENNWRGKNVELKIDKSLNLGEGYNIYARPAQQGDNIQYEATICLIREKVVTFRMVKLNLLLSIFLITK